MNSAKNVSFFSVRIGSLSPGGLLGQIGGVKPLLFPHLFFTEIEDDVGVVGVVLPGRRLNRSPLRGGAMNGTAQPQKCRVGVRAAASFLPTSAITAGDA